MSEMDGFAERDLAVEARPAPRSRDQAGVRDRLRRGRLMKPILRSSSAVVGAALLVRLAWAGRPEIRRAVQVLLTGQTRLIGVVIALEALWTVSLAQLLRKAVRWKRNRIQRDRWPLVWPTLSNDVR
jgi:hypothetical protein